MAKRRAPKRRVIRIKPAGPCPYCENKTQPDYKEYRKLATYVTDRAKIVSGSRSGVCSRHQRRLSIAIKRARHLGLLPFAPRL